MGPLLGRTLILVAHPDDEAVGCGGLLQRMERPVVVFATDGAPRSRFFWGHCGSREAYAGLRRDEAAEALLSVGVQEFHWLGENDPIVDQELFTQLDRAYAELSKVMRNETPDAILTMAYEGGHPDHDACCFLAAMLGRQFKLPVCEMPLYHRAASHFQTQRFLSGNCDYELSMTREEASRKNKMWGAYRSQREVLREFNPAVERFRPLADYDFGRAPHTGDLNYEAWQWPMKGSDLCGAFSSFQKNLATKRREWGTAA